MKTIKNLFKFNIDCLRSGSEFKIEVVEGLISITGIVVDEKGLDELIQWQKDCHNTSNNNLDRMRNLEFDGGLIEGAWPTYMSFTLYCDKYIVNMKIMYNSITDKNNIRGE